MKEFYNSFEPHVSHVLSSMLSSRPMGWSKETLRRFVPIIAAGKASLCENVPVKKSYPPIKTYLEDREKRFKPNTLGLAAPDRAVTFPARKYKVTPLFNALRPF